MPRPNENVDVDLANARRSRHASMRARDAASGCVACAWRPSHKPELRKPELRKPELLVSVDSIRTVDRTPTRHRTSFHGELQLVAALVNISNHLREY